MPKQLSFCTQTFLMFAVIILLISPDGLSAQDEKNFGVKAGFNSSGFYGKDAEGDDNMPGFEWKSGLTLGLFWLVPINNKTLLFQPEIIYSNKGAEINEKEQGVLFTAKYNINYIAFNLPVNIVFPIRDGTEFYFLAGPGLSIKTKSNLELIVNGKKVEEKNVDENTKIFDSGLLLGAGISFDIGPGSLLMEGRYAMGLFKIYEEDSGSAIDIKNKTISLMAGYAF